MRLNSWSALATLLVLMLSVPHNSGAQNRCGVIDGGGPAQGCYYGYGEVIRLTSTTPTELLSFTLRKGETDLFCSIEATGYVRTETSGAVAKVWLEVEPGSLGGGHQNGGAATDEEVTRRYIKPSTGTLQTSFHTSMMAKFDCCQDYNIRLMGSNFSGSGSLYVNYHGVTATCYNRGGVTVLFPGTPTGTVIAGYVYSYSGTLPMKGVRVIGFPNGAFATTDSTGFYSMEVPSGWSGTLSVCSPTVGACLVPVVGGGVSKTYENVTSSLTNENWKRVVSLVPCPLCP